MDRQRPKKVMIVLAGQAVYLTNWMLVVGPPFDPYSIHSVLTQAGLPVSSTLASRCFHRFP